MRCFEDEVLFFVDQGLLCLCVFAPEEEDHMLLFVGDGLDDCVGEGFPAEAGV